MKVIQYYLDTDKNPRCRLSLSFEKVGGYNPTKNTSSYDSVYNNSFGSKVSKGDSSYWNNSAVEYFDSSKSGYLNGNVVGHYNGNNLKYSGNIHTSHTNHSKQK